ncbi:AAA family ATPase [Streptomyces sp. OfavH-34-F]|uniref:AAA family ATPase n=1 Tax=Streptomyces sp. OfavH-34-F TaxID=2917760 RepID=UPI001EF1CC66|nr:AAA family ATPase [Streptomyces sp. OfavH-34-F]MCG7523854.1 AAA family ATPase [Streptomyces sp. OfavH-34-F]
MPEQLATEPAQGLVPSPASEASSVPATFLSGNITPPVLTVPSHVSTEVRELIYSLPEPLRTAVLAALNTPDGVKITMGNAKGGVMKTTLSVYVALILALTGEPVLLVDADDTNKTCLKWQAAAEEDWPSLVTVVGYTGSAMAKQVKDLMARGFKHLVIDVGPTDKGVLKTAWMLTKRGIVPTQQHVGDVVQLTTTFDLLKEMGEHVDLFVMLAKSFPKRSSFSNARDYIQGLIDGESADHPDGLPSVALLDSTVPLLEGIADTWGSIPDDFMHFGSVLAEALGVPASVIAEREAAWLANEAEAQ